MKFIPNHPYSNYKIAYIVTNKENRKHVILYNSKYDRTTISYARYLMSVKLGKLIESGYHVDHIDNDKTNDCIDNLQVLSMSENISKSHKKIVYNKICISCGKEYSISKNHKRQKYCSRACITNKC